MDQEIKENQSARGNLTKIPFWPSAYQVIGCLGFLIGAIGGPVSAYLGFIFLDWRYPESADGGLFFTVIILLVSIPLGALMGTAIGMAIAKRIGR